MYYVISNFAIKPQFHSYTHLYDQFLVEKYFLVPQERPNFLSLYRADLFLFMITIIDIGIGYLGIIKTRQRK